MLQSLHPFVQSLLGGILIGLASWILLLGLGRVAGISGIAGGLLAPGPRNDEDRAWRWAFFLGLIGAGVLTMNALGQTMMTPRSPWLLGGAGLLVGFGTILGSGCTDFQSGSAESLYRSITEQLLALPDDTTVWPGHDYKGQSHSTIGEEKRSNARISGKSLSEFVAVMDHLNLPKPKRIEEAVPANQHSGLRHDADAPASAESAIAGPDQVRPASGYAGDVSPQLAWQWVQSGKAVLVDVRSDAEREWVGFIPEAKPVAWKQWPGMAMNPNFDAAVQAAVPAGGKVLLLCRSGVRSIAAAKRATELGLLAYNILEGFEGDPDSLAHRGQKGGWRMRGLPWRQN